MLNRWFKNTCKEAIDKTNELRKITLQNPSTDAKGNYEILVVKATNKIIRRECVKMKLKWLQN